MSVESFRALGVSEPAAAVLEAHGFEAPFRIQTLVLPDALGGIDILAKSPTGSGKTLAFALPIVERLERSERRPGALVLVPTRELCVQVAEAIELVAPSKGLSVATVYGGVPIASQLKKAKASDVVVATPGRLEDLANRGLRLDAVTILVLDEADRMLDMGFQPQVDKLVRRLPRDRQTMFFSATLDGEVGELARQYTSSPSRFEAELPSERSPGEIHHTFVSVTADNKLDTLVEHLGASDGLSLVFVRTKRGADRLVEKLARRDVEAIAMHGDLNQRARERALSNFESGKVRALVATDVAARGLDLDDITQVINFDAPTEDKSYIHRVGRTGRAGRTGTGITFVLPEEQAEVSRVAAKLGHRDQFESTGMETARPRLLYTSRRGRRSKW